MRKMLVLALAVAGCQPLYGGKPERLPRGREPPRSRFYRDARPADAGSDGPAGADTADAPPAPDHQ